MTTVVRAADMACRPDAGESLMIAYGASTICLFREFLVREGLCDSQRARVLASKLDGELRQNDELETEDGATFIRVQRCRQRGLAARQLGFGAFGSDVDERHPYRVDPLTMTSRLDLCS